MNILLIGSGGREHALALGARQQPALHRLFIAPGNPGTAQMRRNIVLEIRTMPPSSPSAARRVSGSWSSARRRRWLPASSMISRGRHHGVRTLKAAAQLEGSKAFTKDLCARSRHPHGCLRALHLPRAAQAYVGRRARRSS